MCMSNACRVHVLFMVYACQLWGSVLKYVLLCVAVCIAVCSMQEIKLEIFGSQDLSVFLVVLLGDALFTHLKIRLKSRDSRENMFNMYGDSSKNFLDILPVVINSKSDLLRPWVASMSTSCCTHFKCKSCECHVR